jgi:hypothetical protein
MTIFHKKPEIFSISRVYKLLVVLQYYLISYSFCLLWYCLIYPIVLRLLDTAKLTALFVAAVLEKDAVLTLPGLLGIGHI